MAVPELKYGIGNSASTTLSVAASNSDTSMTLTSDTNFAAKSGEGMVLIDEAQATEELVYSASKTGAALSTPLANRGLEGGSAQAHAINATVKGILTVGMWNDLIDSLLNVLDQTTGAIKTGVALTSPKITTGINDTNNNELFKVTATGSAVNEFTVANAATGNNPILSATGGDDNIGIDFQAKGTGVYNFKSTASQAAELRVFEDTDAGSNYVAIKPPALADNYTLTLPTTDGSANQVLQTDGSGVLSWASSAINVKVGSFTRDQSTASGTQAVTGVGFQPKAVVFLAVQDGNAKMSAGVDDGATGACIADNGNIAADTWTMVTSGASIALYHSGGPTTSYTGVISSLDSNGFTITWTRTNTPTGTATIMYLALG